MTELKKKFGKKLRQVRRMRDLSQEQLAEKAAVSSDFISTLERGLSDASFETLEKLAEALEVEVSEFFTPIDKKLGRSLVMTNDFLVKIFEHNNWANNQIVQACYALTDEQLDSAPLTATRGSIRRTLEHLVGSQRGYLSLLTLPVEARPNMSLAFADFQQSVNESGAELLAFVRETSNYPKARLQTTDGYFVDSWVVIVQVINHATEHREQICSMLSALGVTPPDLDGWSYGEATNALTPITA